MNIGLKKTKNDFQKDFQKLMNNAVFGKTIKNVASHRDIELVTTKKEGIIQHQNQIIILQSLLQKILLGIKEKKSEILTNKPVCLGFSILELSEILMYNFWYD